VAIAAGVLAVASGLLMWRDVAYTTMDPEAGVSFLPSSITTRTIEEDVTGPGIDSCLL
jgi:hypothetical protein